MVQINTSTIILPNFKYTFEFFVRLLRNVDSSSGVRRICFESSRYIRLASLYTCAALMVDVLAMFTFH